MSLFACRVGRLLALLVLVAATALTAQAGGRGRGGLGSGPNPFQDKHLPFASGFRVFIVSNMAGMGAAVDIKEIMAGNEAVLPNPTPTTSYDDYWSRFRSLLTQEANAVIRGARLAGGRSFVVSDAHPGNVFGNILPWDLDTGAVLMRGFPRPLFMISGIDSTFKTLMFDGAVASAGSPGVLSHTFGFSEFAVNGKPLNEVAICALIAGEMGVSVSMVSGDDVVIEETKRMLPEGFVPVVSKYALGKMAAITYSPAKVRQMVSAAAAEAVRRERAGEFKPFTMDRPYHVTFTLMNSLSDTVVAQVASMPAFPLEQVGPRSFRFTTESARQIGYLIDAIEPAVIR
jgi:D-amino peptidase